MTAENLVCLAILAVALMLCRAAKRIDRGIK